MNKVLIGLGSNLNPEENILLARLTLSKTFTILKESSFRKTRPIQHTLNHFFLNGCIYLETHLDLPALKNELQTIEQKMGRGLQTEMTQGHPIDLDILVWNHHIIHPDVHNYPFIREAILEILPGLDI